MTPAWQGNRLRTKVDYQIQYLTNTGHSRATQSPSGLTCLLAELVAHWDMLATSFKPARSVTV